MIRGINTGIGVNEVLSAGGEPADVAGRACLLAEHANVTAINVIRSGTDIEAVFGECALTDDLKTAQLNGGSNLNITVVTYPVGYVPAASLQSQMQNVVDLNYTIEFWALYDTVDRAFADSFAQALTFFQNNKRWYSGICQWRKAIVLNLQGKSARDGNGHVVINYPGHGFAEDNSPVIYGTNNYDGQITLLESTTADELHFFGIYIAETFAAGAMLEENPNDYAAMFGTEFETFSCNKMMIVAPTTQANHLGAVLGQCCQQPLEQSIGRRDQGGVQGVSVDPAYADALANLIDHGAVVLKTDVAKPEEIIINDDTVMWTSGEVRNWQQRRAICEAVRRIYYYGNPLINSSKYERTPEGALAAVDEIATGLKIMRDSSPRIISGFDLTVEWGSNGSLIVHFIIYSLNNIKLIETSIELQAP